MEKNKPTTIDILNEIRNHYPGRVVITRLYNYYGEYENRTLTDRELKDIYSLYKSLHEIKENHIPITLGEGILSKGRICIHKTPDNLWMIYSMGSDYGLYLKGIHDNSYDACIEVINNINVSNPDKVIEIFNQKRDLEIDNLELVRFASKTEYIDKTYYQDLMYKIKKTLDINEYEDIEAEKRIKIREKAEIFNKDFNDFMQFEEDGHSMRYLKKTTK